MIVLAACPAPPSRPGPVTPSVERAPAVPPPVAGQSYRVLPAESEVRLLVYRAGPLAKAGHNHVITSHNLIGTIVLPDDPTQAHFEIVMPVAVLAVDEPDMRAQEGADFAADVSESARDGTRKNMLKPEVLDGERFPGVTMTSRSIVRSGDDYDVTFAVDLRGAQHVLRAPVHATVDGGRLTATGEFSFKQSDLGLTPFTALMGALAVQDEMRVKFRIRAEPVS
jgi:polyisoprenoid-binding protein YceI